MNEQEVNTTQENKQETQIIPIATSELAKKLQAMMDEGKTLEEALAEANVKAKGPGRRQVVDRIAYIKELTSIPEIRKASKSAYAKRSKSKDEDQDAKYGDEIMAARDRLNEIEALINASEDPLKKALEYGETMEGIVQRVIAITKFSDELAYKAKKMNITKADLKKLQLQFPEDSFPEQLGEIFKELGDVDAYKAIWQDRAHRHDQRVIQFARTICLLNSIRDGDIKTQPSKPRGVNAPKSKKSKSKKAPENADHTI